MLIQADARQIPLADGCVQCVVTSPPYFGLRDYGTANQIGLEPTPDAFVAALVAVFREVRRVLKDDGTLWVNIGDSYATGTSAPRKPTTITGADVPASWAGRSQPERCGTPQGWKTKDLLGIPWRVAFALQSDGWYLRSDIIWHKPNPMPESVTDRPTKAHEYLFLLTKSERYFYDSAAVREGDHVYERKGGHHLVKQGGYKGIAGGTLKRDPNEAYGFARDITTTGRNKRSVWTVSTVPYAGAHFATMPEKLVEPCILAGSRLGDRVLDPFMGSGRASRPSMGWAGSESGLSPACEEAHSATRAEVWIVVFRLQQNRDARILGKQSSAATCGPRIHTARLLYRVPPNLI